MAILIIGIALANISGKAVNRKVHFGYANSLVCFLLSIDCDFAGSPYFLAVFQMSLYELMRLHEHAAGAAGWVINSALIRLNDFHDEFNNAGWRKKFAPTRAIRKREFPEEVFVDSPESITLNIVWNLIEVFEKRDYGSVIKF